MTVSKYQKELAEMTRLWNCNERDAMLVFLQVIYILRGNSPEQVAGITNHLSDEHLAYCFTAFMDDRRITSKTIDLLSIEPWRG